MVVKQSLICKVVSILCLLVGICGCRYFMGNSSWHVMRDKVIDSKGNLVYCMLDCPKVPEEPLKHKYGKLVVISVDRNVSVHQLCGAFRYFNIEGCVCKLKLSNGRLMPFGVGYLVDYLYPPSLSEGLSLVNYVSIGNCRAIVSNEVLLDDRLLVPYLANLEQSSTISDPIPSIQSKEGMNGFELICKAETTYGEIEDLLIRASSLGYDICSVLGVYL